MNDLRIEAKQRVMELYDSLSEEEKYCDGCPFLETTPPFKGITTADVNVWRDNYKCRCNQYNMIWTNPRKDKVIRTMECIVTGGKHYLGG